MIDSPPVPPYRTGRRGELTAALDAREHPYRRERDDSARRTEQAPLTFGACRSWFRDAWEASLPARMHSMAVEDGDQWGGPRWTKAMLSRIGNASDQGWMATGWDKHGQPRGVDAEGLTRDPFLFHLEMMLRGGGTDALGASALMTWAYMGWDSEAAAIAIFRRPPRTVMPSPVVLWETAALEAMLERTIRRLWHACRTEPVRYAICPVCKRRECVCAQRSEAQVNAEEAG